MSIKFAVKAGVFLALTGLFSSLSAQQSTAPANPDSTGQTQPQTSGQGQPAAQAQTASQDKNSPGQTPGQNSGQQSQGKDNQPGNQGQQPNAGGKVAGTSNDRLFYALPNFLTMENGKTLPPLSAKDKFKVVALGTFDYVNIPWWGAIAAASQAENNEPAFGQGWGAYAKRYGSTAADSIIENFMVGAVYPSLLHQDPRFYYSSNGGIWHRTGYAISRIVVTRSDSGKKMFNFSEIVGAATAAAISTYTYHPGSTYVRTPTNPHEFIASNHTFVNATEVWGTQIGLDSATLVIKEFWPDVHRWMARRRMMRQSAGSATNSNSNP